MGTALLVACDMNPRLISLSKATLKFFLLLAAGFVLGRCHGVMTRGYYYEIREKKTFESSAGPLEWRYVTKSEGLPFLDPGTTELEFEGRTLYSAQRWFQESYPFARDIKFDGGTLKWSDGQYDFDLKIAKSPPPPPKSSEPTE